MDVRGSLVGTIGIVIMALAVLLAAYSASYAASDPGAATVALGEGAFRA